MMNSPRFTATQLRFVLGILLSLCAGCGGKTGNTLITTCDLPSDQAGTLSGRWQTTPIPIALHQGDFSSSEAAQIAAAVATWNEFFGASANLQILNPGSGTIQTSNAGLPNASVLCSSSDISGTQYSQPIVIYKDTTWPAAYSQEAIALTSYCWTSGSSGSVKASATTAASAQVAATVSTRVASTSGSTASAIQAQLRPFSLAITEVNYQYFFTSGGYDPDLQTILLHELGHVLGLNHSCNDTTTPGFPTCTGSGANSDYQEAVMYPVFGFYSNGQGEQRRSLNDNDESRANCLYL
ncbi:MAG: hypothetical protein P4M08_11075 [Oligoflexia bacterium]|nr:hypothetical protein [Oligoflexia bacterium]